MIDRKFIGLRMPAFDVRVEPGRLRFFAKAIGEVDPIYIDEKVAIEAGHKNLPVPPTFLFCLEMESPDPAAIRNKLGLDYRRLLHGEQSFTYYSMAYSGDVLRFEQTIDDIYDKKNGDLEFVVRKTKVTNQDNLHIADLRCVTVMQNR